MYPESPSQIPLFTVKTEFGSKIINVNKVLYVEANNKHSIVYFDDLKIINAKQPLKWFETKLVKPYFYRIHDSFIINCCCFEFFSATKVILKGNIVIPLSRYKKQIFLENMNDFYKVTDGLLITPK